MAALVLTACATGGGSSPPPVDVPEPGARGASTHPTAYPPQRTTAPRSAGTATRTTLSSGRVAAAGAGHAPTISSCVLAGPSVVQRLAPSMRSVLPLMVCFLPAFLLLGEDRGGREHQHLLALAGGLEGGAQRHLGLAEADVAADQPVHRLARGHVGDRGSDGGGLVRRLLETEPVGERLQVVRRHREGVPRARGAPGVASTPISRSG